MRENKGALQQCATQKNAGKIASVIRKSIRNVFHNTAGEKDTLEASNMSSSFPTCKYYVPIGTIQATPDAGSEASLLRLQMLKNQGFELNNLNLPSKEKSIAATGHSLSCVRTLPYHIVYGSRTTEDILHIC